ncbi:HEAT repeat domain-containing protein [Aureimonas glaciei]|uniref:PBS lyase n=1 Tax=Aureimonas glaciei TaxID=1776957 RepID=A0A916YEN1_9HYPH|nr:HEAT repeat domain-containing protein [Aureimonas glaciei]GGD41619.1 PBS lyase [Aureimonas glaciei]
MPLILSSTAAEPVLEPVASIDRSSLPDRLADDDVAVRREAVRFAAQLGLAQTLSDHLANEPNGALRETIFTTLVRLADEASVPPLVALLRSEDVGLRNAVIETLQAMGDIALPELERLLADPDVDVRIFAMNVAQSLGTPKVPALALRVLTTDEDVNVCAAAVEVLSERGHPDMADAIRQSAARFPDQPFLAFAIRAAVKRIG